MLGMGVLEVRVRRVVLLVVRITLLALFLQSVSIIPYPAVDGVVDVVAVSTM